MKTKTPIVTVSSQSSLKLAPVLVIAALMAFCPTLMRADTIALSFTGTSGAGTGNTTQGYAFTLSNPLLVTQLGVFDFDLPGGPVGLQQSIPVTIWTSTGTLEAQGTVPSGTAGTLTDGFRYVSIAPVMLSAGSYTIGAFYATGTDLVIGPASTITTAPGVTYSGTRSVAGNAFPAGNSLAASNGYFGPNFQFTAATSAPDTGSTLGLLSLSVVALLGATRLRFLQLAA
jgi:hypothetical protein